MTTSHDTEPEREQSNFDILWRACALGVSIAVALCAWAAVGFWLANMADTSPGWRIVIALLWPLAIGIPTIVCIGMWVRTNA